MEQSSLSELISVLEKGTKIHISVAFYGSYGNHFTHRSHSQMIHDAPVCLEAKTTPNGLAGCYRCRKVTERMVRQYKHGIAGVCQKGVYEYCRPIFFDEQVIGVIFIGNILTSDKRQRERLQKYVRPDLLNTMEDDFTQEDCRRTADVLHSYIIFLLEKYGNENHNYDPLIQNIKSYIREQMAYNVSLKELAEVFNYNEKYLGQLFKSRCGYSIKGYCNYIRIKQAKRMLTDTKLSVSKIAQQLGFSNVTYFDRVFRYYTGISPHTYRLSGKEKR